MARSKIEVGLSATSQLRWGLCCAFAKQPIKFRTTTATSIAKLSRTAALTKLSELGLSNTVALQEALTFCASHKIGCFRIVSQILPLATHATLGYQIEQLPDADAIVAGYQRCGQFAAQHGIRTCFHPDQFVVLNSRRPEVVEASIRELEYQALVAQWVGADVINIHGGGAFGDKPTALADFERTLDRLSDPVRQRLTVENDDRIFTVTDLLPVCQTAAIPLVYDVHHHRCLNDGLTELEATQAALATWNREPMFHLSSPLAGWKGVKPERHHDYIDPQDFPSCWLDLQLTIEVEAKAKELAIARLKEDLQRIFLTTASR